MGLGRSGEGGGVPTLLAYLVWVQRSWALLPLVVGLTRQEGGIAGGEGRGATDVRLQTDLRPPGSGRLGCTLRGEHPTGCTEPPKGGLRLPWLLLLSSEKLDVPRATCPFTVFPSPLYYTNTVSSTGGSGRWLATPLPSLHPAEGGHPQPRSKMARACPPIRETEEHGRWSPSLSTRAARGFTTRRWIVSASAVGAASSWVLSCFSPALAVWSPSRPGLKSTPENRPKPEAESWRPWGGVQPTGLGCWQAWLVVVLYISVCPA